MRSRQTYVPQPAFEGARQLPESQQPLAGGERLYTPPCLPLEGTEETAGKADAQPCLCLRLWNACSVVRPGNLRGPCWAAESRGYQMSTGVPFGRSRARLIVRVVQAALTVPLGALAWECRKSQGGGSVEGPWDGICCASYCTVPDCSSRTSRTPSTALWYEPL